MYKTSAHGLIFWKLMGKDFFCLRLEGAYNPEGLFPSGGGAYCWKFKRCYIRHEET